MSLNHLEAIPVDTHVLKIATDHYLPNARQTKSMTPKLYNEIGDAFREVYGTKAGWAQTGMCVCVCCIDFRRRFKLILPILTTKCHFAVLFCADLSKFKENAADGASDGCSRNKKRKK